MGGQNRKKKRTASEPWTMDELQHDFEKIIRQAVEGGDSLTQQQIERIASGTVKSVGKLYYRSLIASAPPMLRERLKQQAGFELRNLRRWRKAFDLLETIGSAAKKWAARSMAIIALRLFKNRTMFSKR